MDLLSRSSIGLPQDAVLSGTLALVALDTGLGIFDVASPASTELIGHLYLPAEAHAVAANGDLVFVANGRNGLAIIDIADPQDPILVSTLIGGDVKGVDVVGNTAYLALGGQDGLPHGLQVVDVSNPAEPLAMGIALLPNEALAVTVREGTAFVGIGSEVGGVHGLTTVDVRIRNSPTSLAFLATSRPVHDLALDGSLAFLATGFTLTGAVLVVDVTSPVSPTTLSIEVLEDAALGVSAAAGVVHVAARSLGVLSLDYSSPDNLQRLDTLAIGNDAYSVTALGDVAFVCGRGSSGAAGFTALSTPPWPERMQELTRVPLAELTDVAVLGGGAFLLSRDGLLVLDAADVQMNSPLGVWSPPGADLSSLALAPGLAAISDGVSVHLVSLRDITRPTESATITLIDGAALDVALADDLLVVVDGLGMQLFDVGTPENPLGHGYYDSTGLATAVALQDEFAFLASGTGLDIVDLSTPSSARLVARLPLPTTPYAVAVDGGLAVLSGLNMPLMLADVSNPEAPFLVDSIAGATGLDVTLQGTKALVAAGEQGLLIFDVSSPAAPVLEGWYETSGSARAVSMYGNTIHLAACGAQHWALDCLSCAASCGFEARVSPTNAVTCQGMEVSLSSEESSSFGCDAADIRYQWFEGGVALDGATASTFLVPDTQELGLHDFEVTLSCTTEPACTATASTTVTVMGGTAPTLATDSLRLTQSQGMTQLSWQVLAGDGDVNVHRTLYPVTLDVRFVGLATAVSTQTAETYDTDFSAGIGRVAYFRVFPSNSCTGDNVLP